MIEIYLIALAGVVLGQLAPGPNLLAVASAALGAGRRQALAVAAGVASAVLGWVALATLGLAAFIALHPGVLVAMKLVGGAYLVWIAARALRAALAGGPVALGGAAEMSVRTAFVRGVLINVTNPKSAMMWAALATFLFGTGLSSAHVLLFAPMGAITALCVYGFYALVLSAPGPRRLHARFGRVFDAAFGAAFGAVGAALLADGVKAATR